MDNPRSVQPQEAKFELELAEASDQKAQLASSRTVVLLVVVGC